MVFASEDSQRLEGLQEALGELLALRQEQAGERYREYSGAGAYRPGETKSAFLARHGAGPGPVDPENVPYYLLLVSDPEKIPYRFQYQLDVQHAVGRLHFVTLDEYAQYARSVVAAESGQVSPPRLGLFFGVQNPHDQATFLSATRLSEKLRDDQRGERLAGRCPGW